MLDPTPLRRQFPSLQDGDAEKNGKNTDEKAYAFFNALLREPELKRDGTSVRLRCRTKCDVTEVLAAILEGEIGL